MKKAKIILTTIAFLATLGGVIALKASRINQGLYFCDVAGELPTTYILGLKTTAPTTRATTTYATSISNQPCLYTYVTVGA